MEKSLNEVVSKELGENIEEVQVVEEVNPRNSFFDILKTPTGEGSIDDYIDKPLNFDNSKGLAQVLRGLTGLLGALDFALVDIVVGAFRWSEERKEKEAKVSA